MIKQLITVHNVEKIVLNVHNILIMESLKFNVINAIQTTLLANRTLNNALKIALKLNIITQQLIYVFHAQITHLSEIARHAFIMKKKLSIINFNV